MTMSLRSRLGVWASLAVVPAALSSCSFLGLDNLPRQACNQQDSVCAPLNSDPAHQSANACLSWQCGTSNFCELLPVDADGDGDSPPACATVVMGDAGSSAYSFTDCDDNDARRAGHTSTGAVTTEACGDNVDNDCNGVRDDMSSTRTDGEAMVGSFEGPNQMRFAVSSDPATAIVAATPRTGASALQVGVFGLPTTMVSVGALAAPPADTVSGLVRESAAVAALTADRFVAAYGITRPAPAATLCSVPSGSTGPYVIVHEVDAQRAATLPGRCIPITAQQFATPVMYAEPAGGSDVLLVWVADASSRSCSTATASAVRARRVRLSNSNDPLSEELDLGQTGVGTAPAITFVAGRGWIVAHVDENGALEVQQISNPNMMSETRVTSLGTFAAATAITQVTASAGPVEGSVALTQTLGGCVAAQTGIAIDVLELSDAGASITRVLEDLTAGRRTGAVGAFFSYGNSVVGTPGPIGQWVIAYQTNAAIELRRFDAPVGEALAVPVQPPQVLMATSATFDAIALTPLQTGVVWMAQNGSALGSSFYGCGGMP